VEPGDIHGLLMQQQADVAISLIYGRLTEGLQVAELLKLSLVLFVPDGWKVRKFADLLVDDPYSQGKLAKYPLVGLPPHEILAKVFQESLDEREINWAPSMEVDSLDLIAEYAVRGFGVGLGVAIPGKEPPKGLRVIRLPGFPPLVIGAIYQGLLKPIAKGFLEKAKKRAKALAKRG
jgi:DNA-binding transcriptional LysR family regulator